MFRGSIGDYGSHYPILAATVAKTKGPVLEMGAGDWSTPMLHYMCKAMGRTLHTVETNAQWLERFKEYEGPGHQLTYLAPDDWLAVLPDRFGVIFIDGSPGEMRHVWIQRLQSKAHFIVAHDSEKDYQVASNYMYEKVRPLFKYVNEFQRFRPYTVVLSDEEPFEIDEVDRVWTPPDNFKVPK